MAQNYDYNNVKTTQLLNISLQHQ